MTNPNAVSANDTLRPEHQPKTLSDCQYDAVHLAGLLEAIAYLDNDGQCAEGRAAITCVALDMANRLGEDLDRLETRLCNQAAEKSH